MGLPGEVLTAWARAGPVASNETNRTPFNDIDFMTILLGV
jgi:hypothetical protein